MFEMEYLCVAEIIFFFFAFVYAYLILCIIDNATKCNLLMVYVLLKCYVSFISMYFTYTFWCSCML